MLTLRFFRRDVALFLSLPVTLSLLVLAHAAKTSARQELPAAQAKDEASLLDGFRHVEVASVSDALEQIANKKMYMTHRMRPIFQTRFAGYALTVSLKKDANHDPDALKGMLQAIDTGTPNSVYVMVVEDGNDIAGMGGLMGTAMAARNFSGAVIDGGVRDTAYLQKIGFPSSRQHLLHHVPFDVRQPLPICRLEYPRDLRRRTGKPGRYHHRRSRWRSGCTQGHRSSDSKTSAGNGLQGALDVCLHREA